jgi:HK97 family phage prohead protease
MNTAVPPFADRLVTLSDGRPGLRGGMHVQVYQPTADASPSPSGEGRGEGSSSPIRDNSCNSCLDFISSDETLDRYGEIITAAGWNLDDYLRNPVFQNSHQYGDIIFTLGKAHITEIRQVAGRQALFQRIEFATDANPMARIAYALYSRGFLNSVSVGFIPVRWEDATPDSPYRRKFLEQKLLEVSAVAIPANPNALALAVKSGAVEKSDLKDTLDLIRHTLAPQTAGDSPSPSGEGRGEGNPSSLAPAIDYRPLFHLARQLAAIMRRS